VPEAAKPLYLCENARRFYGWSELAPPLSEPAGRMPSFPPRAFTGAPPRRAC
jgi:hypothetical protein